MKKMFIILTLLSNISAFSTEVLHIKLNKGEKIIDVSIENYEKFQNILEIPSYTQNDTFAFIELKTKKTKDTLPADVKLHVKTTETNDVVFLFNQLEGAQLILSEEKTEQYEVKDYLQKWDNWPIIELVKTPPNSRRGSAIDKVDVSTETETK